MRRESTGIKRVAWMNYELIEKLRSKHKVWLTG